MTEQEIIETLERAASILDSLKYQDMPHYAADKVTDAEDSLNLAIKFLKILKP